MLSLSGFPLPIRFLSSASLPVPATQPLFLPFLFLPGFASQRLFPVCQFLLSLRWFSPFFKTRFPVFSFPVLCTRLSVCFLSSFPVSLPQLFHRCLPYAFAFGIFPLRLLSFVCFRLGSDYSAFRSFFSLLPVFPCRRFLRCIFSSSVRPVAMPFFRFRYSAYCKFFFSDRCFVSQWLLQRPDFIGRFPLACALGSGYSAFGNASLSGAFHSFRTRGVQKRTRLYYHTIFLFSTLFLKFFKIFNFFCK